ncbi:MAG: hypothetical protein K9J17_15995 [Flavobacteriales bacterium]|nr:hypothetical protein [Flavobacteriales bacterium]
MDTKNHTPLTSRLTDIMENERGTIRAKVAEAALEYSGGEPLSFFRNLLSHGCVSGIVNSLIYYVDTHSFFDEHYDEIEELRLENFEATGVAPVVQGDMKNWFAWFSFEETARMLADELGI